MRSRLGLLLVLSAAAAACSADDDGNAAAGSDLTGVGGLSSVAITKIGDIPLGVGSSFMVLDDDRAVWGSFGATDKSCSETPFTRFSAHDREANAIPSGAWSHGRVSPNGKWVAAIGTVDGKCGFSGQGPAQSELRVGSTSVAGKDVSLGTWADFAFTGDLVVRFENDGAHALTTTGDPSWTVRVAGAPNGIPWHAVGPTGAVFVYASGSAKVVANDGTATEVTAFPPFFARADAAPRATFVAAGTIIAELPMATGYELWKITQDGAVRLAQTVGMALYTADTSRFAVVSIDGAGRSVDVYDVASLVRARISGLDTVTTIALSAKGDRIAAAGTAAGKTIVASAPTSADATFTVLGEAGGVARTLQVLPDGRTVFNASVSTGTSSELGMFVAGTESRSVKRLTFDDTLHSGAISFEVEPGATPTTVIAQKIIGKAVLLQLDGSGARDLDSYSANVAWTNGFDFYSFQDGATLGVVTAKGLDEHTLIPNENPVIGTRFDSGVASTSGRFVFIAAGAGVYRIDTAAPAAAAGTSSSGGTHSTPSTGATPTDGTGAPTTGTSGTTGTPGTTDSSGTSGPSTATGNSSSSSRGSSGESTGTQQTTSSASSGGCSTTGGAAGGASPLALGLVVSAFLRRRRRAV